MSIVLNAMRFLHLSIILTTPVAAWGFEDNSDALCKSAKDFTSLTLSDKTKKLQSLEMALKILDESKSHKISHPNCLFNLGLLAQYANKNWHAARFFSKVVNDNTKDLEAALLYALSIDRYCGLEQSCKNNIETQWKLKASDAIRRTLLGNHNQLEIIKHYPTEYPKLIHAYVSPLASLPYYEYAIKLYPENSNLVGDYGLALANSKKYTDSQLQLEILAKIDPQKFKSDPYFSEYFYSILEVKNYKKVVNICTKYTEECLIPHNCFHFSKAYYYSNDMNNSERIIRLCIKQIPIKRQEPNLGISRLYHHLGTILHIKGDVCGAMKYYRINSRRKDRVDSGYERLSSDRLSYLESYNTCKNDVSTN